MWYKVKHTREEINDRGKLKKYTNYYLVDCANFAEAGYKVMEHHDGEGEVEDVMLLKSYKPTGNIQYNENNKVFIVKFSEDFMMDDGTIKTQKYPVPFYANSNTDLQSILEIYMKQGLDNMRVTNVTETNFIIL